MMIETACPECGNDGPHAVVLGSEGPDGMVDVECSDSSCAVEFCVDLPKR